MCKQLMILFPNNSHVQHQFLRRVYLIVVFPRLCNYKQAGILSRKYSTKSELKRVLQHAAT